MSSAGDLNVKLTASTGEFVGGMAAAQRSIDNVQRASTKGRASLSALGASFRLPGLTRGAAFGGAASNALAAFGLGGLGGGAAGIAATAVFSSIQLIQSHIAAIEKKRAEYQAKIAAEAERAEAAYMEQQKAMEEMRALAAQIIVDTNDPGGMSERSRRASILEKINAVEASRRDIQARLDYARVLRLSGNETGDEVGQLRAELAASDRAAQRLRRQYMNPGSSPNDTKNAPGSSGGLGDKLDKLEKSTKLLAEAEASRAATERELAQQNQQIADEFRRANQRMSDQLTTHTGGISAQIGQLIMKSGRGE